jgi:protease I
MRKALVICICGLLAIALTLVAVSCGGEKSTLPSADGQNAPPIQATGKKVLIVIPQSDFQDKEFTTVHDTLTTAGCQVVVATRDHAAAIGVSGTSVTPDALLGEVKVTDYKAVVFIGGPGAENLYNLESARNVAVEAVKENRVLGAICLAPVILARAGVLEGRRATVYYSASRELTKNGAEYTGAGVEVDGRIITGNGPEASSEFAQAVLSAL